MKITKSTYLGLDIYEAKTSLYSVTIRVDRAAYIKKLFLSMPSDDYSALSQMVGISYTDYAPNKIIERMIKRLESIYNI